MTRSTLLRACAIGVTCLLSFGLARSAPRNGGDDPAKEAAADKDAKKDDKTATDKPKEDKAKDDKAKDDKAKDKKADAKDDKAKPQPKDAVKVENERMRRAVAVKAAAKKGDRNAAADWFNAAVGELFGKEDVKRAPGGVQVVVPDNMVRQMEQQFGPRVRQMYKSELHFMRGVCKPTRQQFDNVAADGEKELKAAIHEVAQLWAEAQQGRRQGNAQWPDTRKVLATQIVKSVKTRISSEAAARYQKEIDARDEARKRVTRLNLLAAMDRKLLLSAEQRDKLDAILDKNWHSSWGQLQMLMQDGQYFPQMPDDKIFPILTESQKTVWRGIQKGNVFFGFELNMFQGVEPDEEEWPAEGGKK
jgi:hypothetical protein